MPYVAVPTFTTGEVLTAGKLNILSDDLEHINSVTDYVNLAFSAYTYGLDGTQDMEEHYWVLRHRHRYLHYYLSIDSGSIVAPLHLDIAWQPLSNGLPDWRNAFRTSSSLSSVTTKSSYVDLEGNDADGIPITIPDNAFVQIRWDASCTGRATARYFLESSFTSL